MEALPFLRIPPFPGHRAGPLTGGTGEGEAGGAEAAELARVLRELRVGGAFWEAPAMLPAGRGLVLAPCSQAQAWELCDLAAARGEAARAVLAGAWQGRHGIPGIAPGDPWALAARADAVLAGAGHELALIAALAGRPVETVGAGRYAGAGEDTAGLHRALAAVLAMACHDPFTGRAIAAREAAVLLGDWRALIEANRGVAAVHGVARWKRVTMDALLWDGTAPVPHGRAAALVPAGARVLAWRTRSDPAALAAFDARGVAIGEIEDGMIRSTGLGANCVPPLSVIIDPLGAHFDPRQPSTLETILNDAEIPPNLIARAGRLRERLVAEGISKYERGEPMAAPAPRTDGRRRVLVTGQVEDDRAVILGGAGCSNRELLACARAAEPGAELIWRPHPDVEAGHRKGHVPEAEVMTLADRIDRDSPIARLLGEVDALHVISSLAGFEALLRGVEVTTHGVPFYAGWGLTRDLGPVPARRQRARGLDELVAAVLLIYPRYLDPVTRLPCPAEVLVERMARGQARVSSPLVMLREWQGRARTLFRRK